VCREEGPDLVCRAWCAAVMLGSDPEGPVDALTSYDGCN
jgi:hypothetical protein